MTKAKPGDIVRNKFGVVFDVMEYNHLSDQYKLHIIGESSMHGEWIDSVVVDDMKLFRKVN